MKIIIDAMGGDNAPLEFLKGAFQAARECNTDIVLVGRVEELLNLMKEQGMDTLPKGVELMNAEDVVDMHDDPANVVKATVDALSRLRTRSQILETRGKKKPEKGKERRENCRKPLPAQVR